MHHAPKINSSLGVFGDSVKVATRVFTRRGDVIYPRSKAELPSFRPAAAEPKNVPSKKPVSASVFEGTVGITSAKAGSTAHRFDGEVKSRYGTIDPHAEGGRVAGVTVHQSKNNEARFFEQGARKGVAVVHADGKGITTATAAGRDDSIRFENSKAALGRTHAAVVGDGAYAGVGSNSQAHEIDRYHVEPKTKVGYAVDDGAPVAGVGASTQPRYIDRYHGESKPRLVTRPTDDGTVAGMVSTSAPHVVDRYHVEPRVNGAPAPPRLRAWHCLLRPARRPRFSPLVAPQVPRLPAVVFALASVDAPLSVSCARAVCPPVCPGTSRRAPGACAAGRLARPMYAATNLIIAAAAGLPRHRSWAPGARFGRDGGRRHHVDVGVGPLPRRRRAAQQD